MVDLKTLRLLVVVAVFALACGPAYAAPNIVLIMADDMGFADTAPFGSEISTPNLTALANTGVRYTHFYNTARCSTTRASLLTGQYSHNVGMGALPSTNYNYNNGGTMPGYSGWFAGSDPQAPDNVPTLPEVMKTAGYDTSMSGKWHLTRTSTINSGPNGTWPTDKGFDRFYGTMEGAKDYFEPTWLVDSDTPQTFENSAALPADFFYTNAISQRGAQFIRDEYSDGDSNPFFHYHAFYAPHFPLQAPADATDAQGNNLVAKYQAIYSAGWDTLRDNRLANQIAQGLFAPGTPLSDKADSSSIPDWNTLSTSQKDDLILRMAVYAAQVEILDQGVGELIDAVQDPAGDGSGPGNDSDNMMDDTVFVFLSDNGAVGGGGFDGTGNISNWDNAASATDVKYGTGWANLSDTPFRKFKTDTYEGGIASPLIISGYGVDAALEGTVNTADVGHVIDLAPTFFEMGNATYPSGTDATELEGQSLVGTFDGAAADLSDRDIFFEHEGNRGVRSGNWKLVAPNGSSNYELYDLSTDRAESTDLSGTFPEIEQELRLKWEAWAIRNQVATPNQSSAGSPFLSNDEIDWLSVGTDPSIVARFSFDADLTSSDTNPGSTAADVVLGSEITRSPTTTTLYADGNDPLNTTFAGASANGFTAEFDITSVAGVDLDVLSFIARFNNMDAGETGSLILRSSADGFASDLISVTNGSAQGTTDIPVDLDVSGFADITNLTFRFYFLGVNNATNERTRIVGPITLTSLLMAGDMDFDRDVDEDDIDALFAEHGNTVPPVSSVFDLVADGTILATINTASSDMDELVRNVIGTEYGDANLDKVVSLIDLNVLGANFGMPGAWGTGDFNGDGTVSLLDLNLIGANFGFDGTTPAQPAVPEPAGVLLLSVGALVLSRRRKRTTEREMVL